MNLFIVVITSDYQREYIVCELRNKTMFEAFSRVECHKVQKIKRNFDCAENQSTNIMRSFKDLYFTNAIKISKVTCCNCRD